jgi:hypothetical protein
MKRYWAERRKARAKVKSSSRRRPSVGLTPMDRGTPTVFRFLEAEVAVTADDDVIQNDDAEDLAGRDEAARDLEIVNCGDGSLDGWL